MASPSMTWSPSSFQLRLAFNCRKPPPVFIRALRIGKKLDRRRVRVISVAGHGVERRPAGNSWINSSSSADAFSGWSGADGGGEQAVESQRKRWFGGIVGAGAAGLILVAGLTFAALSVSKRRITRPALEIEPLKTQHEVLLASDDQNDRVEQNGKEGQDVESDDSCFNKAGIDNDSSLSTENNEAHSKSRNNGSDMGHMLNSDDDINNAPIQEDFQNVSAVDDISVASHESLGTTVLPEPDIDLALNIENSDGILVAERSESDSEVKETPIDAQTTSLSVSDANPTDLNFKNQEEVTGSMGGEISDFSSDSPFEPLPSNISGRSQFDAIVHKENVETLDFLSARADLDLGQAQVLTVGNKSSEEHNLNGVGSSVKTPVSPVAYSFANEQDANTYNSSNESITYLESRNPGTSFSSAGIPAPSVVSAALQVLPGKVLVPAVVDQVQGQALAALQVLKVIEADVQPGDLCTRREYARWLVSASSTLSRNTISKVYPAMYIENVTELAFDDITPEDPDFPSIQGLAEAGLISSKLSRHDMASSDEDQSSLCFSPESPLSRQDLVTWKMALEKKQLPKTDRKILQQLSGFIDIDKINPDAWPALMADLSAGENGIIGLAFGYTRLFQPDKPVTKSQAAIALATGEASDIVSEELARIEAESMAENAVAAHTALVAQVEKDVNASFEKELSLERVKIDAVEKLAEEARQEVERLRAEREKENITLMKERAAVESEMEVLVRLRCEVEEQLESLMSNKVEISYEKERLAKLLKEAETENQEIARLQHDLEVERKALSMARAWAEDEAKRAREQAKVLEEARDRWERHGIKVVVEDDLREEANVGVTWLNAGNQFSVEETVNRAETLVDKLKAMAINVRGKARDTISQIIQKIVLLTSVLKEHVYGVVHRGGELKDVALTRMDSSFQELQQSSARLSSALKEGAKRVAGDCKEGVEKLTQKFKT